MSVNDHRIPIASNSELFEVKLGSNDKSATFIFGNEDHTLGNSLRYVLSQRKEVDFVGYSVPHPYEPKLNVRLQTKDNFTAIEILKLGLNDLGETANILDDIFINSVQDYYRTTGEK